MICNLQEGQRPHTFFIPSSLHLFSPLRSSTLISFHLLSSFYLPYSFLSPLLSSRLIFFSLLFSLLLPPFISSLLLCIPFPFPSFPTLLFSPIFSFPFFFPFTLPSSFHSVTSAGAAHSWRMTTIQTSSLVKNPSHVSPDHFLNSHSNWPSHAAV